MLKNKIAIVTDGTRGIGLAIVRCFLKNGAKVILCGSKAESFDKALNFLKEENDNYEVYRYYPNLCNKEEVRLMFNNVCNKYGEIDILVNNTGISSITELIIL